MRHQTGFTLIELLIVVLIMGVLAAVAIPAYQKSVQHGNRSSAEQLMLQIASLEQQYFLDARTYTATIGSGGLNVPPAQGPWTCAATCADTYYTVTVVATPTAAPTQYTITAAPLGKQVSDGTLYYNATTAGVYSLGSKVRTAGDGQW